MKTRIGKIARLPKNIRDELNRRLENGGFGNQLLVWLNGLPDVQRILAEHFDARPITKHNLSAWRHGGFADWIHSRECREQVRQMADEARSLHNAGDGRDIGDFLGTFVLADLGEVIQRLHEIKDRDKRWKCLRMVCRELSRLRTHDQQEKRLRLKNLMANQKAGKPVAASEGK